MNARDLNAFEFMYNYGSAEQFCSSEERILFSSSVLPRFLASQTDLAIKFFFFSYWYGLIVVLIFPNKSKWTSDLRKVKNTIELCFAFVF